jgi:MFS family permease
MASAAAGLMVIYCIKLFGIDKLTATGMTAAAASATAGTAMAWFAIFNGAGRVLWGIISDPLGRKNSMIVMCASQALTMFAFYYMGNHAATLTVGACIIGFNYGGNFALFPSITADYFGNKNVGLNYGYILLGFAVAALVGPQIAGYFRDAAKVAGDPTAWLAPFLIAGCICIGGCIVTMLLKPPVKASS